jgi:WD40 repeat protein
MTPNDTLGRDLSRWLHEDGEHRVPDHLAEVLVQTVATRQRPWWSSPERWLHVDTAVSSRAANLRPLLALVVIGALLLAAVGIAVVASQRQPTPVFGLADNGRIFVTQDGAIQSLAADGTDAIVAVQVPGGVSGVSVAPDGKHLAYLVGGSDVVPGDVVVRDLSTGGTTTVPLPKGTFGGDQISWSPDSTQFVMPAFDGASEHLVVASADGSDTHEIGAGSILSTREIWWPAWSPDGSWIAVGSKDKVSSDGSIYLIHPDGTGLNEIVTGVSIGEVGGVRWAPDPTMTRLVFVTPGGVYQADILTTTDDVPTADSTYVGQGFWPTWSPDGQKLAWWDGGLVVADTADLPLKSDAITRVFPTFTGGCGDHTELAGKVICQPAVWSPDGRRVIGLDPTGTSMVSLPIDGSEDAIAIPIDAGAGEATVAWQPIRP